MGPSGHYFTRMWTLCGHCKLVGIGCIWVELPVQRRPCLIFYEWCRVTQHPQLFRRLAGCQRDTPVLGRHSLVSEHKFINT